MSECTWFSICEDRNFDFNASYNPVRQVMCKQQTCLIVSFYYIWYRSWLRLIAPSDLFRLLLTKTLRLKQISSGWKATALATLYETACSPVCKSNSMQIQTVHTSSIHKQLSSPIFSLHNQEALWCSWGSIVSQASYHKDHCLVGTMCAKVYTCGKRFK